MSMDFLGPENFDFWDRKLISCACARSIESGELKVEFWNIEGF